MKLLIDQNISVQIIESISDMFPDSVHVNHLELNLESDLYLWKYALKHELTLVSTDKGFFNLSFLHHPSPKVIFVSGDMINSTKLEWALRINENAIEEFSKSKTLSCLELKL